METTMSEKEIEQKPMIVPVEQIPTPQRLSQEKDRKTPFMYKPSDDINLLKQVLVSNPFAATYGRVASAWDAVAAQFNPDVNGVGVKNRVMYLISARLQGKNLKKGGTEQEYEERQVLIDEVSELQAQGEAKSAKRKLEDVPFETSDKVAVVPKKARISPPEETFVVPTVATIEPEAPVLDEFQAAATEQLELKRLSLEVQRDQLAIQKGILEELKAKNEMWKRFMDVFEAKFPGMDVKSLSAEDKQ